jgi:predicted TPR repeat methyltransferase
LTQSKKLWSRVLLRGVHYSDRHRQLDVLYRVRDPWGLDCDRERLRFEATNAIIQREFGHVGSLLELGCGEGLQSAVLAEMCDELHGIDVSAVAVGRARERCPDAAFDVGDVTEIDQVGGRGHFDLVVGCEMLYYVKDVPKMVDRMSTLGDACLVTYYVSQRERLDAEIALRAGNQTERIRHGETEWIAAWWRNPSSRSQTT